MIKLCLVPGGGFADAVVARVGIFSMLAAGSGAGRPRVLSGLRRDIVGGGRQHRRRLIKLCLVPSVGFADAVVARVGIFSMLADGSSAGRARSLSSSLRRTIGGSARQRWRRLIRVHLVPGGGFANAVVARVGIFSMLADGSSAGRPRVLSSLRRDYRWRRSPAQETADQAVPCSRRGIRQCRHGQNWNLFHGRRRERRRAAPGPEQPETHYRWRRSAAQGTNDQSVSCSRRGTRQRRRGQSWNLFHGRRRERRRAAPGPEQPETHYRWRRSAAQGTNDQRCILFAAWDSPTPSWPELESFPWSAARAAPGGPRS